MNSEQQYERTLRANRAKRDIARKHRQDNPRPFTDALISALIVVSPLMAMVLGVLVGMSWADRPKPPADRVREPISLDVVEQSKQVDKIFGE